MKKINEENADSLIILRIVCSFCFSLCLFLSITLYNLPHYKTFTNFNYAIITSLHDSYLLAVVGCLLCFMVFLLSYIIKR